MQESDVPFAPGRVLAGRYRIERRIARGGMADVYAAIDPVLGRKVAIKAFRLDSSSPADHRRIDREIRMLASLRDPGLVTVFDAGFVPDGAGVEMPFLVMELIDGPTLSDRLKGRRLPQNEIARLGAEVATTLVYVHKVGIVHRDIKPANILLDPITGGGFRAKVADFGIARLVDSTRFTAAGAAVGTANYVSPEQALGERIGPPSDIYSLALILIECMSGSVVFPGTGIEAVSPRLHRDPTMPRGVSAAWVNLLERMTARKPGDRPTAAEVAQELGTLAQAGPQAPVPPPPTAILNEPPQTAAFATRVAEVKTRRPIPKRPLAIAAAAMVAAVLGLGIWAVIPSDDGPEPTYPAVEGQLGDHLSDLEGAIP